jgi:hypothetical protein
MGYTSKKNYILSNAAENILSVNIYIYIFMLKIYLHNIIFNQFKKKAPKVIKT